MREFGKYIFSIATVLIALTMNASDYFCNPINLPYRYAVKENVTDAPSYREAADPTVVVFNGEYYLFASKCGVYYHSTNLIDWKPIATNDLPMEGYAPTVVEMEGALYFTHSVGTTKIWKSTDPKSGRWELIAGAGTPQNENDPMLMYDGVKLYLYYGSSGNPDDGIMGVELDKNNLRPIGKPVKLITVNRSRFGWEVPGDYNDDYLRETWIEGVWVTPHNGLYYLQYSAPGTETKSYCDAVYVSDNPLGPYKIQRHNPLTYHPEGFCAAAGHGSTFKDINGNWWHIVTGTISKRHMFERRLVLYPVSFSSDGMMYSYCGFGDYPYIMPDNKIDNLSDYSSGMMLLSYRKPVITSSCTSNHPGAYAVNEDIRTWWAAETGDKGEYIQVDLGPDCNVNAIQLNFADEAAKMYVDRTSAYRYKLEASQDGKKWFSIADKSRNNKNAPHDFVLLKKPMRARYVRLTNVYCPSGKFSLSGFRVFGHADKALAAIPRFTDATRDLADLRHVHLSWESSEGATGYNIRYGTAPDRLYNNYKVYDTTELDIRSLDSEEDYYFVVDAFNEAGVSQGKDCKYAPADNSTFSNPVIYADVPDPDVIRVDDNFYMVSTTMHFSPGCPIMKSKDLVNWKVIGYAYDQLEETDGFALKNGQNDYARGSWAANLRYDPYEKRFYLFVTCNTTMRSYLFTTNDIEKGCWHRNVVEMCYDPGLLFDDNGKECRKYILHPDYDLGKYTCYIREILSDEQGNVVLSEKNRL